MSIEKAYALSSSSESKNPIFVVDSACTVHVCNDKTLMKNIRSIPRFNVEVANGKLIAVDTAGEVALALENDVLLTLKNVAYSSLFSSNLVSVKKLLQDNSIDYILLKNSSSSEVKIKNIKTPLKLRNDGNLYTLPLKNPTFTDEVIYSLQHINNKDSEYKLLLQLHEELGHLSCSKIIKLFSNNAVRNLDKKYEKSSLEKIKKFDCSICSMAKATKEAFSSSLNQEKAMEPLHTIHCDISGPYLIAGETETQIKSLYGHKYYSVILDEHSNYISGMALRTKDEVLDHLISEIKRLELITNRRVKFIKTDGAKEYCSNSLLDFCREKGITKITVPPYTPQLNGKVERVNRTLGNMVRSILIQSKAPLLLWPLAMNFAVFLNNRFNIKKGQTLTPHEIIFKMKPSLTHLHVFGCDVFYLIQPAEGKLEARGKRGIFVGYDPDQIGTYLIFDVERQEIKKTRNVNFPEVTFSFISDLAFSLNLTLGNISSQLSIESQQKLILKNIQEENEIFKRLLETSTTEKRLEENISSRNQELVEENSNPSQGINEEKKDQVESILESQVHKNLLKGYDYSLPDHRELWLNRYVKQKLTNEEKDKIRIEILKASIGANISWKKIAKNYDQFKAVSMIAYPTINLPNEQEVSNSERKTKPPNTYGLVNYESSELQKEGTDLFGDIAQLESALSLQKVSEFQEIKEPFSYQEALSCKESENWKAAMIEEYNALTANNTFSLSSLPPNKKPLDSKWVYRIKFDETGKPIRFKARLVVKGFLQKAGEDYNETFSPVMKYQSFRLLLSIATILNYELEQFDVDNAFLNATLKEEIFLKIPLGINTKGDKPVFKLNKSLYGLKQAPLMWYTDLHLTLSSLGFSRLRSDSCVYFKNSKGKRPIIIGVFVDDALILFDEKDLEEWKSLKEEIKKKYKIKDIGKANFILGMRILRDRKNRILTLDQQSYIEKILKKSSVDKERAIPGTNLDILLDPTISELLSANEITEYQKLTGSLLYAAISTRLDILHSVSLVCRFNHAPRKHHVTAVKRIYEYLNGTKKLKLIFNSKSSPISPESQTIFSINAFADADFAGDKEDRKSTSGTLIKINSCPIYWGAKKQKCVSKSSCQAELISCSVAINEVMWIRNFLIELNLFPKDHPAKLFCDNIAATMIANQDLSNSKTKHIAVHYHFVKESVDAGEIDIKWISNQNQEADIFTKVLSRQPFQKITKLLMGEC